MLNDVETFEVNPHGMRRIRNPAVSKGIGGEKIAEFVIPAGLRDSQDWDERAAEN